MKRSRDQVDGPPAGKVEQKQRILLSFDWDMEALEAFVGSINAVHVCSAWWQTPSMPPWVRTRPPYVTPQSLVEDMLAHLRPLVGGRMGTHMLTMATFAEYTSAVHELQAFVNEPFVQAAMDATVLARPLASLHVKFDVPGFAALERSPVVSTTTGQKVFT